MGKPKILVVDDEKGTLALIKRMLGRHNYDIIAAQSGEDAIVLIEKQRSEIDVILLDVMMPGLDGFEVLDILMGNPESKGLKVIMFTALSQVEEKVRALSAGASDYLIKPFEEEELVARIETQLALKRGEEDLKRTKEKYKEFFEGANELMFTSDINGFLHMTNRRTEEFTGYSKEELIGKNILKFTHPDDQEKIPQFLRKIIDGESTSYEFKVCTKKKNTAYMLVSGRAVVVDGKPVEIQYNAQDITSQKKIEEKLKQKERYFNSFINNSSEGVLIINGKGIVTYQSQSFERIFGYKEQDTVGCNALKHVHPYDLSNAIKSFEELYKKNEDNLNLEVRFKHNDGTWLWIEASAINYLNDPEINGIVANFRDITYLKECEKALKEYTSNLKKAQELANMGNWEWDYSKNSLFISEGMSQIFKISENKNNSIQNLIESTIYQEDRGIIAGCNMEDVTKFRGESLKFRIVRPNGEIRWVIVTKPVVKEIDNEGNPKIISGTIQDMTEHLKAETELKKATSVFDIMSEGVTVLDLNGLITDINQSAILQLGYEEKEAIGKNSKDLFVNEGDPLQFKKHLKQIIVGGFVKDVEYFIKREDGSKIPIILTLSVIKDFDDNPVCILAIHRDNTENKKAQRETRKKNVELQVLRKELNELNLIIEQKIEERTFEVEKQLKHKDEFINQLVHDIKNPLSPLTSLLPLIEKKGVDPKSKELLEICIQNVDYIKNLVINALQLSRLNSEGNVLDIEEINLLDIVNSVVSINHLMIEDNKIVIENKIDRQTIVLADEIRLMEVFNNLISNAIKFTPDGGKLILDVKENGGGFAKISIRDSGIGMNDEVKSHLFEEFYKADKSKQELESSGLGLVICKRIVEKHGGKIWAESEGEGNGTTFYFTIPKKSKISLTTTSFG